MVTALYWAGEAYFKAEDYEQSYKFFSRLVDEFASRRGARMWVTYARGRLTHSEFDAFREKE